MWRGLTSAPHAVLRSELFLPSCVISFIHLRLPRQIAYYNLLPSQITIARKEGDHVIVMWCLDSWKIWSGLFSQPSEAHNGGQEVNDGCSASNHCSFVYQWTKWYSCHEWDLSFVICQLKRFQLLSSIFQMIMALWMKWIWSTAWNGSMITRHSREGESSITTCTCSLFVSMPYLWPGAVLITIVVSLLSSLPVVTNKLKTFRGFKGVRS